MNPKFCIKCGKELREYSKYCDYCGAKWKLPKNHKLDAVEELEPVHKKKTTKLYLLLSALALLMLSAVVLLVIDISKGSDISSVEDNDNIITSENSPILGKDLSGTWVLNYLEDSMWENDVEILGLLGRGPGEGRSHLMIEMKDEFTGTAKFVKDEYYEIQFQDASMVLNRDEASIIMKTEERSNLLLQLMGTVSIKEGVPYIQGTYYTIYKGEEDDHYYTCFGTFTAEKIPE